ncbi:TPA: chromosome condensation regulator RCC1, partial [Clostridioides difficile]|nr:chromosome condensation regulator RCC1 [Clostridioides difficile]
ICGNNQTFIQKEDGSIWSTGNNSYGELGLGDTTQRNIFTKVDIDNVKKIACGQAYTFIIKNDGTLYSCGFNYSGQLGLGD